MPRVRSTVHVGDTDSIHATITKATLLARLAPTPLLISARS
jgi:hypothetical protein